ILQCSAQKRGEDYFILATAGKELNLSCHHTSLGLNENIFWKFSKVTQCPKNKTTWKSYKEKMPFCPVSSQLSAPVHSFIGIVSMETKDLNKS
ncbi:hypothetical protein NXF25_021367, partial [Crotalus adamanteus]